ncbi:lipopolysaccharide biosynthesis protein [Enterococcus gilvus]|uniref:lipopolysaccharide biosynthesis protein n=1 Tax=Enterococcus gilvus TaxID=160453 RepID=UPI00345ED878
MDKYKKLVNNSIIFAIGNFGSKIISFVMVPLYTYVLSSEDYGKVDLIITTVSLLIPYVTMLLSESLLRFIIDNSSFENKKNIYQQLLLPTL